MDKACAVGKFGSIFGNPETANIFARPSAAPYPSAAPCPSDGLRIFGAVNILDA